MPAESDSSLQFISAFASERKLTAPHFLLRPGLCCAQGLFKGLGPRVAHVALTSATFFALFEYTKLLLKPQRVRGDFLLLPKLIRKRRDHVWKRQLVIE